MSMSFYICAAITTFSALVSLGFSIAAIPNTSGQTRTLAFYASARSLAFAILSAWSFVNGSAIWLEAAAIGMIIVQAIDALIGITIRDIMKTLGPAATSAANLAALVWLAQRA
jgi:hypothetical protein